MKRYQKSLYTLLLLFTCLVASPFIFHQIWKNSKEAKRTQNVPPPVVSQNTPPSESNVVQDEGTAPELNEGAVTSAGDASGTATTAAGDQNALAATTTEAAASAGSVSFVTADPSYFDDALFIGDSRTVGIQENGNLKNADYFCDIGLSAYQIDDANINGMSFEQAIDAKQYGKVYVMLGINEVGNDFEYTVTKFRAVIEKIKVHQPNAIIYIEANLHVSAFAETNVINNAAINYLNSRYAELADNKKVFYIDVNTLYDDEYGYFNSAYTDDGVHPYAQYYKQWCEWLCTQTVPTTAGGTETPGADAGGAAPAAPTEPGAGALS